MPIVVTGFEPLDLLDGILRAVRQLESGQANVENAYSRVVTRQGNPHAQQVIDTVFRVCDRDWRGIGVIPRSGLTLREEYAAFDAERRFPETKTSADTTTTSTSTPTMASPSTSPSHQRPICLAGAIMRGTLLPTDCPSYANVCVPRAPLGAPMVSAEGTCAAFHSAGRRPSPSRSDHAPAPGRLHLPDPPS